MEVSIPRLLVNIIHITGFLIIVIKCDPLYEAEVLHWLSSLEDSELKIILDDAVRKISADRLQVLQKFTDLVSLSSLGQHELKSDHRLLVVHFLEKIPEFYKILMEMYAGNSTLSKRHSHNIIIWPFTNFENYTDSILSVFKVEANVSDIHMYCKYLTVDTSLFLVFPKPQFETFSVFEIYCVNQVVCFEEITNKELKNVKISFADLNRKVFRRSDFNGLALRVLYVEEEEWWGLAEVSAIETNGTIHFVSGMAVSILRDLAQLLNFTYINRKSDWVSRWSNGSLKGRTHQMLNNGSADLLISASTMLPFRAAALTFIQPSYHIGIKAFFRQPSPSSIRDIYMSPFSPQLWYIIIVTWIFAIACLELVSRVLAYRISLAHRQSEPADVPEYFAMESVIWGLGAVCQQGWHKLPDAQSLRIVIFSGIFLSLLSYSVYLTAIVSTLSIRIIPITSFTKLMASPIHVYGDGDSSTMKYVIENLKAQGHQDTIQGYMLTRQGLEVVMTQKAVSFFAFAVEFYAEALEQGVPARTLCRDIYELNVNEVPYPQAMLLTKHSPYREYLNYRMIQLKEWGLNKRYTDHFHGVTGVLCSEQPMHQRRVLDILDVITAFIVLLVGSIASLAFLSAENGILYWNNRLGFTVDGSG